MAHINKYIPKFVRKLMEPYMGMPKEVYVIFISRIVNGMGCFVSPFLTLILTKKIGLSSDIAGLYMSIAGILFMPIRYWWKAGRYNRKKKGNHYF